MKLRICLLCDTLTHGGAETHICTLANALAADGHKVTVASGGGPLAKTLRGVRTVTLPLPKKRYALFAFLRLWRLFRRAHFDIIHAHTRYTAALARPLARGRMATTAHWVFDTSFPKRQLTFWGKHTLAVSEDIKAYLTESYSIPKERITVTVNGIDTARFSPKQRSDGGRRRIVYASRLSPDRAEAAFALLDACMRLPPTAFSLTVMGDGACLPLLKQRAEALCKTDGRYDIRFTGATSEVERALCTADIFVGVSRAALEAMACGCAVILAGNEGYLSVFSPETPEEAERTNLCCRGAEAVSADALWRDLSDLLDLPARALRRMGEDNRRFVLEKYSAERMASDALAVYQSICKEQCVLCGYYGFGNLGDALLCRALNTSLKTARYGKVAVLSRRRASLPSLRTLLSGYDFFLGGGNLLQDATSRRSLSFYLFLMRVALLRGCRVYLLSAGFGPLSEEGEARVRAILPRTEAVYARTRADALHAKRLGAPRVILASDAVLSLSLPRTEKKGDTILLSFHTPTEAQRPALLAFVLHLCHRFDAKRLLLFPMHPYDHAFTKRLAALTGITSEYGSAERFLAVLSTCVCAIGTRLHLGVCALGAGVPFFLWEGEEKCRRFVRDVRACADGYDFCGTFSFADRGGDIPAAIGMEQTHRRLRERQEQL